MSNDLDRAFIDYDLDVPQVQIMDISEVLMDVAASIEQVMMELANTAEPEADWLEERAALLRSYQAEQNNLIANAFGIIGIMAVRKENRR